MKKLITLTLLVLLTSVLTVDIMGMQNGQSDNFWPRRNRHRHHHSAGNSGGSVGAPLDGGLLAVLGIAGAAYVTARKKKNGSDV